MKVLCRVCGRRVERNGMQPHSAMHRRRFAKAVGRRNTEAAAVHMKYEYVVAYFNPRNVPKALADWVACAEGQRRITNYL
jgi:hypothetical protein